MGWLGVVVLLGFMDGRIDSLHDAWRKRCSHKTRMAGDALD